MDAPSESFDRARLIARLDLELRLVADAVEVVAQGRSARVTIGGIRFGDVLLVEAQRMAAAAGLVALALYSVDESWADLVIERPATESPA